MGHALAAGAEFLEEFRHLDGVVSGFGHEVGAERVGFAFGVAGEFEDEGIGGEAEACLDEFAAAEQGVRCRSPRI